MVCSCGLDKGTITGEFETYFKTEWHALFDDVYGKYVTGIDGNFLFHSVPYTELLKNDSLESDEYNKLGTDASLGCVRLAVSDAKWIYDNCPVGTYVKIYDRRAPACTSATTITSTAELRRRTAAAMISPIKSRLLATLSVRAGASIKSPTA